MASATSAHQSTTQDRIKMPRRKSIVGLTLLGALLVSAFMAQSAFAAFAPAKKLTAFTCVPGGGAKDFKDAHCDEPTTAGTGSFGHVLIPLNTKTSVEVTNAQTKNSTTEAEPAVWGFTLGGANFTITAKKVSGTGFIEDTEPSSGVHKVAGEITVKYTETSVVGLKCTVKEPIEFTMRYEGVELGEEAGLEFRPRVPPTLFTLKFNEPCPIKQISVNGTAIGTGTPGPKAGALGATTVFEPGNGMESLTLAGNPVALTSKLTTKMVGGNPIALTTLP